MDSNPNLREIRTRAEFIALASELGVRPDWHEPDEQAVTARWGGTELDLDNAMGVRWYGDWLPGEPKRAEMYVILCRKEIEDGIARRGPDLATINLANLLAWASEPHERPAKVGHYLNEGFEIPANVAQVEDAEGDLWNRTTPEEDAWDLLRHGQVYGWRSVPTGGGLCTDEGLFPGPVKVTQVREPHQRVWTGPGELEKSGYAS